MQIEDMHYRKRQSINNIVFTVSTFLIALGIQGLLPLPPMFAWFFVFSGNLAIYWVAWNDEETKINVSYCCHVFCTRNEFIKSRGGWI